jgi:galactose mutarotase-like enzyme
MNRGAGASSSSSSNNNNKGGASGKASKIEGSKTTSNQHLQVLLRDQEEGAFGTIQFPSALSTQIIAQQTLREQSPRQQQASAHNI